MGRAIFKMGDDQYLEWSTVVDSPVTLIMPRSEAVARWGEVRVARADCRGHSFQDNYYGGRYTTPEELIGCCNRAGPNEETLTLKALMRRFGSRDAYESFQFESGDRIEHGYVGGDGFWVEHEEMKIV